ncbi:MAG: TonB-dependent receptor [Cyclobacteriaceae bacterium]
MAHKLLGLIFILLLSLTIKGQSLSAGSYKLYDIIDFCKKNGFQVAFSPDLIKNQDIILSSNFALDDYTKLFDTITNQTRVEIKKRGNMITLSPRSASNLVSIRGKITDFSTGENLLGASVSTNKAVNITLTNEYGGYMINTKPGEIILKVSFIGYKTLIDTFIINKNSVLNLSLQQESLKLNEITVSSRSADLNLSSMITGTNSVNLKNKGQIPYFLGEEDVIQTAIMMPGIKTIGEDANGLYIRGGNVDQNLILMDEAPIYNPNHFYGLISVFNPEVVNSIDIFKGYTPPKFGGRASSVINVHQRNGDKQDYHFTGGIGLISAKAVLEGPIKKGKSSFILSGRQSLLNRLSLISNAASGSNSFRDINLKVNLTKDERNTFFLAGYYGRDQNEDAFETVTRWGNTNMSARWNRILAPRIVSNFSAIVSAYQYRVEQPREAASFIGNSRIIDYNLKSDFQFAINPTNEIEFGSSVILHRLKPGDRFPFDTDTSSDTLLLDSEHGIESAFYLNHNAQLTDKLSISYGFRQSLFQNIGSGEVYQYDPSLSKSDNTITDTVRYGTGETIKFYHGLEPRLSINYRINSLSAIKTSYNHNYQYLHLISSTINPSPTDIWKLSDSYIKPTNVHQVSLGYYKNSINNNWELFVEGYYKQINNTVSYKNGADLLFNPNPETELLTGEGRAYGMEFFLKRNVGKLLGWVSYTLSKSEQRVLGQFENESINNGEYFPSDHDRTHFLSTVLIAELGERINASASFNYGTGRPITLPIAKYEIDGKFIPHFVNRNQSRLPAYHRLDLSLRIKGKEYNKKGDLRKLNDYWTFVLYNVYARKNAYSYVFRESADLTLANDIEVFSVIKGIVPGITYNFSF